MQKLGLFKAVIYDTINTKFGTGEQATEENIANDTNPVAWHDFTLKELLEISKQNQWNAVSKDITGLILSLSKYNPTKTPTTPPLAIAEDVKTESKDETENEHINTVQIVSDLREEFSCNICMDCFIEPLTLSCGHTFCRLCVMQINSKCQKKCPLCKTCSHIDAALHSHNIVIQNCVKQIFSSKHIQQRQAQLNTEKENLSRSIPVFILNMVRYPGMMLDLHLFEPRYLHMINRAISSGNRFAYLCKTMNSSGGYQPYDNDVATLIKIKECQFLPDGRCLMQGKVEKRIIVTQNWVEKGTQGLWYVKYADYVDNSEVSKLDMIDEEHLAVLKKFITYVYNQSNATIRAVENECGARVTLMESNIEQWSFWACAVVYIVVKQAVSCSWIKNQLHTKDTLERIQACFDVLKAQNGKWNK